MFANIIDASNSCKPLLQMKPAIEKKPPQLALEVLQQFRVIYGSMRQYFREMEESCGLTGSQMWVLQEVQRSPEIGVSELAARIGIHQSTCSQIVD